MLIKKSIKSFTETNTALLNKMRNVSLYKRIMPGTGIPFNSIKSQELMKESLISGNGCSFFHLIDQHQTQSEPSFCGPATLTTILNSLGIDPKLKWKG